MYNILLKCPVAYGNEKQIHFISCISFVKFQFIIGRWLDSLNSLGSPDNAWKVSPESVHLVSRERETNRQQEQATIYIYIDFLPNEGLRDTLHFEYACLVPG